jgi:hypothetical protein
MKKTHILLGLLLVLLAFFFYNTNKPAEKFISRTNFEKAMEFIKVAKPTPPESAIFYAKVSEDIYNKKDVAFDEAYFKNTLENILNEEKSLPEVALKKGTEQNEYWIGEDPFSPKISQYPRFLLKNFSYQVPPPPKFKSPEFYQGLKEVNEAAKNRTTEQSALINFYGGVPGTVQPAGIWQNIMWENVKDDKNLNDQKYAYNQMLLAKTLADSFMECWKVKYIYQTKRPNMTDKTIDLAMPNPKFASYTSGHSTISFSAAGVLTSLFPEQKEIWVKNATDAKNSRLWAGIHFPYDNNEGQKLGEEVAKNILENL